MREQQSVPRRSNGLNWLQDVHEIVVSTDDGARLRVVAHRKGFPPAESPAKIFVPAGPGLAWEVWRYVRWNLAMRRRWTVGTYTGQPGHETVVRMAEAPSRQAAFALAESEAAALREVG